MGQYTHGVEHDIHATAVGGGQDVLRKRCIAASEAVVVGNAVLLLHQLPLGLAAHRDKDVGASQSCELDGCLANAARACVDQC